MPMVNRCHQHLPHRCTDGYPTRRLQTPRRWRMLCTFINQATHRKRIQMQLRNGSLLPTLWSSSSTTSALLTHDGRTRVAGLVDRLVNRNDPRSLNAPTATRLGSGSMSDAITTMTMGIASTGKTSDTISLLMETTYTDLPHLGIRLLLSVNLLRMS